MNIKNILASIKSKLPKKIDIWYFFHITVPNTAKKTYETIKPYAIKLGKIAKKYVKLTACMIKGAAIGAIKGAKEAKKNFIE